MLRNDASKLRARRSPSDAVQRLNAATSTSRSPRRRRLTDAIAVAAVVAAFAGGSVDVSSVYAQRVQASNNAQTNAQRGNAATQTPLFSGKFVRGVSEKFSRDAETQNRFAPRRPSTTPDRAADDDARSNRSAAPGSSAAFASSAQRSSRAPSRNFATPYAAPRPAVSKSASKAAPSAEALAQASTSRESAQEALAKIPWKSLSPAAREKLVALAKNPTIYRRLPMAGGYCNPELFDFFLAHPHAVVGLWRQMGYDDVSMERIGPNLYSIREKTGTVGRAQILYQDNELTLVYCSGKYQGPVVPRSLDGEMFLVLQTRYTEDPTGRPIVVCRLDAFVDLKNPGADLLARTFSGALGKLADSNFEQTLAFIDNVSQNAETNPGALSASIAGLSELSPEARRLFAAKTSETARQAQLRARGTYVDYQLLPKLNSPTPTVARVLSRERAGNATANAANAANAALAARSRSAVSAPLDAPSSQIAPPAKTRTNDYTASSNAFAATTSRAGSVLSRPSTSDNFGQPSLAQNSFALSDDAESDYDFESELDWDEEESIKVGGAFVAPPSFSAPTLVPETSVARTTARPATRFSDALDLVESTASDNFTNDYAEESLDAPLTLATDAPLFADDESTTQNAESSLLVDFENELLDEAEANDASNDAASSVAKPAPLAAFQASDAVDAVALPVLAPAQVAKNAPNDKTTATPEKNGSSDAASTLPVLVFDAATSNADAIDATEETDDASASDDDVPLLLLPDFETAEQDATPPAAPKVALKNDLPTSKSRGRAVAPIVPNAKKPASAKTPQPAQSTRTPATGGVPAGQSSAKSTGKDAPAPRAPKPAPVWRAVESKPAQVAPPIAETARVASEKGATFRKPEIR